MAKLSNALVLLAIACLPLTAPARAQPIRTFVALTGTDANPCTFALPCKSVQHAHDVVAAGGEIRMLDRGSYGLLTITKAISIHGDGFGAIAAQNNADAITINAGPNDKINLRGLVIEGFGSGGSGITFNSGGTLDIQDCLIRNFIFHGINFVPTGASVLLVSNSHIAANVGNGIVVAPPVGTAAVSVVVDRSVIERNGFVGVFANGDASFFHGTLDLTVSDSVVSHNGGKGIMLAGAGATILGMVRGSVIAGHMGGEGLLSSGGLATLRVTKSTIWHNATGFAAQFSAGLISFGDNSLDGNTTDGAPTSTIGYH